MLEKAFPCPKGLDAQSKSAVTYFRCFLRDCISPFISTEDVSIFRAELRFLMPG